eukprot:875555-Rhodomonas_salina.1
MLWERAREVLVEAGITRTEEIQRDGTWCIPRVPRLTQAMTVGLMHQLQPTDWEDGQVLLLGMGEHIDNSRSLKV